MTDIRHEEHENGPGFERQDLGSKPIFAFIISVVVIGVLVYYVIWGIFHFLDAYGRKNQQPLTPLVEVQQDSRNARTEHIQRFPEPRLEENERTELNDFRYSEEEKLNSAGWVDQGAGVAHIPITRAMELIAQRGLPTTPQAGTVPASPVNMSRAAAAQSDTSQQKAPANKAKGKQQ
jgi:hypothetical protein